jgi:hypothetical protein
MIASDPLSLITFVHRVHLFVLYVDAGYAAQSLLAAIGCVQFVSNVLFAKFVLKEKVNNEKLGLTDFGVPSNIHPKVNIN